MLVYFLYWKIFKKQRLWLLLIAGCYFYGSWDWRFLLLLSFTSGIDFISAIKIANSTDEKLRKTWLIVSVSLNLITLGFFKYYDFFAGSLSELLSAFELKLSYTTLNIVLPVGISFYTFQSIAYVTDVYREKINAERSALHYFTFIAFFPQMVAGPIERAKRMLPQFHKLKQFNIHYFESGINLLFYGFFKKVVIADNLALFVDSIYSNKDNCSWYILLIGVFSFAIQIYTDFSGYSDIARGCAQLLGFKLSKNFYFPYFSRDLKQFWKRWHISLSSWFRDYVYIPLGGNKAGELKHKRNLLITFLVSGLWHGANFTYIFWGLFHGLFMMFKRSPGKTQGSDLLRIPFNFFIVSLLFVLFRSPSLRDSYDYLKDLFTFSSGSFQPLSSIDGTIYFLLALCFFFFTEIIKYRKRDLSVFRYNYYLNFCILILLLFFGVYENAPVFIYFQF